MNKIFTQEQIQMFEDAVCTKIECLERDLAYEDIDSDAEDYIKKDIQEYESILEMLHKYE